jgi:hypothetical protein
VAVEPVESETQRVNRNFDDLLQELRVAQMGTQILFAFLLTVPFSNGFHKVTDFQRGLYFVALLLAALSAALFIAPAAMHRVDFRRHLKEQLLETGTRFALAGHALLTITVACVVLLIGDYIYGIAVALPLSVAVFVVWTVLFFVVPLRLRHGHASAEASTSST